MSKFSLSALLLVFATSASAGAPITLATGEFAPYSGEHLSGGGMITSIVLAAFNAVDKEVDISYLPWKRGLHYTSTHRVIATYPYVKDFQREEEFLFSDVLFSSKVRLFVRRDSAIEFSKDEDLKGLTTCVPLGYSTREIDRFLEKGLITIKLRAISDKACLNAVHVGEVDFYSVNENTGWMWVRDLFGPTDSLTTVGKAFYENHYYLIVANDYPDVESFLQTFNDGLRLIKSNGTYKKLVSRYLPAYDHLFN